MKQLIFSISCICCLFEACTSHERAPKKAFTHFDSIQMIVNSPYSCYNEIKLDNMGVGVSIYGIRVSDSEKIIKTKKGFRIDQVSDRTRIDDLIQALLNRKPIQTRGGYELHQYKLSIDGKRSIEIFGYDSLLNGILRTVRPYAKNDSSGQCDIFNIMK